MERKFFTKHTLACLLLSAGIVLIACVMAVFGLGLNMGIDFTGGSTLRYDMKEAFDVDVVDAALSDLGITDYQAIQTGSGEAKTELQIYTKDLGARAYDIHVELEEKLRASYPNLTFVNLETVNGGDLTASAVKVCLVAFITLIIYIGFRFDFYFGLAALVTLLHDVLIMCSFMIFFRSLYPVNFPFIAAVLTIIGYSINNIIVVFNRIRENRKNSKYKSLSCAAVVEDGVEQTLSRMLNTAIAVLLVLVTLYIAGVPSIREFTFPLLVGMLAGAYSSVMLSGQIWAHWMDHDSFAGIRRMLKGDPRPKKA